MSVSDGDKSLDTRRRLISKFHVTPVLFLVGTELEVIGISDHTSSMVHSNLVSVFCIACHKSDSS